MISSLPPMLSVILYTKPFPLAAGLNLNVAILLQNSGLGQKRSQSLSLTAGRMRGGGGHVFRRKEGSGEEDWLLQTGERLGPALCYKGKLLSQQGWRQCPCQHQETGDAAYAATG